MNKEDLLEILSYIDQAEELRPIVKKIVETLESFAPEVESLFKKLTKWIVQNRIEIIKMYEDAGFSRDESIFLTIDQAHALKKYSEKISAQSK
jgi:hypothetical protein